MESKTKILFAAITAMLMCAGFVAVFTVPSPVGAGDVGSEPLQSLDQSGAAINAIAWAPDGSWGLAVGGSGNVWAVEEGNLFGTPFLAPTATSNALDTWNDVAYDPNGPGFYVVGDGIANGHSIWYYSAAGVFAALNNDPALGLVFNAIVVAGGDYMVVGSVGVVHFWNSEAGEWRSPGGTVVTDVLYDVAFSSVSGSFLIVGANESFGGVTYNIFLADAKLGIDVVPGASQDFNGYLKGVDAYPGNTAVSNFVVVGTGSSIYVLDNLGVEIARVYPRFLSVENFVFNSVSIDPTSTVDDVEAVIVGEDSTAKGSVVKFVAKGGDYTAFPATDKSNLLPLTSTLIDAAYKAASSPAYWIVIGLNSGVVYYQTETGGSIQVDTIYPHIDEMGLYVGYVSDLDRGTSVMNEMVDIENSLTLFLHARHDHGWAEVSDIVVDIWWDDVNVGVASSDYMANTLLPMGTHNRYARFMYNRDDGVGTNVFTLDSGAGGGEIVLNIVECTFTPVGGNEAYITFEFVLGKQAWAADGVIGGGAKLRADQINITTGLLNANTWDIMATINGETGGSETLYDEFGVYKYAELTSAGLPGTYSGSGPPGSSIPLTTGGTSYVEYSVNTPYSVGVYASDHLYNETFEEVILVNAGGLPDDGLFAIGGDLLETMFSDIGYDGVLWFHGVGGVTPVDPNANNVTTRTNNVDGGATNAAISFICDVSAGVPDDNFSGTLVYIVEIA